MALGQRLGQYELWEEFVEGLVAAIAVPLASARNQPSPPASRASVGVGVQLG